MAQIDPMLAPGERSFKFRAEGLRFGGFEFQR